MNAIRDYLRELAEEGTRTDPLVFAGRTAEIGSVLRAAANPPPEGPVGRTVLVQGAPGSGKTALFSQLRKHLQADDSVGVISLETVPVDTTAQRTYGHLATLLVHAPLPTRNADARRDVRLGGSLGIVRADTSSSRHEASPTFYSANDIASEFKGRWGPKQRVVILVDEVQEVVPGTEAAALLRDLHTQAKVPVLLACAGLSNSERTLADAGLSRIDNKIPLGRLSSSETLDCAQRSLRTAIDRGVRASHGALDRWAEALARASDDWPRHLQVYLQATWQALSEQDKPDLDQASLESVVGAGNRKRLEYYESRIAASGTPAGVIAALHRRILDQGRLPEQEARETIWRSVEELDEGLRRDWAARFDGSGEKCFTALLRAGVVDLDAMNRCGSPMPSFSRYLTAGAESDSTG